MAPTCGRPAPGSYFRAPWTWAKGFEPVEGVLTCYRVLDGIGFGPWWNADDEPAQLAGSGR